MGEEAVTFFLEQYRREENPKGNKWEPRKNPDPGRALLVKSGRLRKSIRIQRRTVASVTIGSNVEYGKYHQIGTAKMPARPFLGSSEILNRRMQRLIRRKIMDALRR